MKNDELMDTNTCIDENVHYQKANFNNYNPLINTSVSAAQSYHSLTTNKVTGDVQVRISTNNRSFPRSEIITY